MQVHKRVRLGLLNGDRYAFIQLLLCELHAHDRSVGLLSFLFRGVFNLLRLLTGLPVTYALTLRTTLGVGVAGA